MDQEVIIFASWWLIVLEEFRHSVICLHRQSIQQHKTWGTTKVQTVNQGDPGLTGQVQGYIIGDYTAGVKQCAIYSPLLYNN